MPVSVRDSQTIGQKAGEEHKKLKNNSATVKADVEKNAFENGTLPVDFEGLRAEDPKFEVRVNAFLRDKDDILGGYPNMDQEDLFALYEFKDPMLFSTSEEDGLSALGRRLTRSVRDEAKREAEAAYYPPEDEDGENIDKLREDTYNTGFKSEEKFSEVLPGAPGIESKRNVATFPLRTLQTKAFDEITVMVPNPEYDAFLEQYGSEAALVDLATAGVSVPNKEIPRKIDGLTLREDSPNLIQVDIFGSDEKYIIDLNAVVLNEKERKIKKALLGAFDKIGLTFDGFRQKANELWGVDTGEPTESVRPKLTGNPRQ
jgi:hypothetical protein